MLLLGASLNSVHQILGRTTETGQVQSVKSKLEGLKEVRTSRIGGGKNYVISVSYLQFALEDSAELETLIQAIENYPGLP